MAGLEKTTDSIREPLPDDTLIGERTRPALRQRIDAPPPSGFGRRPMAAEKAGLLESMQRGIDRSFRQFEGAAAAALNLLNDRIAMRRPARQRGDHDHVEVPFEHFTFHSGMDIPSTARGQPLGTLIGSGPGSCPARPGTDLV